MSASAYRRRRRALLAALTQGAVAIVPAAPEVVRSRDVHHPFRQSSDLTYLTGFPEPEALAVFVPGRKEGAFVLFCRPRDEQRELWDGVRIGVEGAVSAYGADQAHPMTEIDSVLPGLLEGRRRIYYPLGLDLELDRSLMGWIGRVRAKTRAGVQAPTEIVALSTLLHEQRLIKDGAEIKLMRKAARISAAAHKQVMRLCRPGDWEYALEAAFVHSCAEQGGRFQAYSPIVGGGSNACVLHYVDNGDRLRDGDLVLIDAGCEYQGYASDITRTFPVNGRFSPAQRELYELVLEAQLAAIAKAVPGNRWNDPHEAAVRVLTKGLARLGILPGGKSAVARHIKDEKYKPFYMHRTGHWLGMDVHDVGEYKLDGKWRTLEPGMVLTVEPGLYIPDGVADSEHAVPEAYRHIGIRIEDDVLITEGGNEVLSAGAPKSVAEIEAMDGELDHANERITISSSSAADWWGAAWPAPCVGLDCGCAASRRWLRMPPLSRATTSASLPCPGGVGGSSKGSACGATSPRAPSRSTRSTSRSEAASALPIWTGPSRASRPSAMWPRRACSVPPSALPWARQRTREGELSQLCPARLLGLRMQPGGVDLEVAVDGASRTLQTKLLVAADGGDSFVRRRLGLAVRERSYGHDAIIATVTPDRPQPYTAYERFTDSGPLAMLPMTEGRWSVVWTTREADTEALLAAPGRGLPGPPPGALRLPPGWAVQARAARRLPAAPGPRPRSRGRAPGARRQRRPHPAPGRRAGVQSGPAGRGRPRRGPGGRGARGLGPGQLRGAGRLPRPAWQRPGRCCLGDGCPGATLYQSLGPAAPGPGPGAGGVGPGPRGTRRPGPPFHGRR